MATRCLLREGCFSILSPGQQQRLGFVRILRAKPHVALLDESSSCLDEAGEEQLYSLLVQERHVVSIGHRTSLLKHHKQVLQLRNGGAHLMTAAAYTDQFLQAT
ncbi:ABC transporter D family member 2 [Diplonema papillatum]|nr:ABC transporter D family member 2 [Diplonema papillatum]